jgi:Predicted permease, DMT superfamily
MIFALPFFAVSATISSRKSSNVKFTSRQWAQVALVGCLGYYISSLLDFKGLQYVSAGIERLILFIYPTMVLLMSAVIFKIKIKPVQWLALGITYVGLLIAFVSEANLAGVLQADFFKGSIFIFICAITYASYIVGSGRLIPVVGASKFNSYAMSFASVGVFVHFLMVGEGSLLHLPWLVYFYSFAMAILSTVIPSYLVTAGIKRIGSGNAAIVGSIGPVSTILMAYFFLNESISFLQIVGTICIILGVLLIGRNPD